MLVTYAPSLTETLDRCVAEDPWNHRRRAVFSIRQHFAGGPMPPHAGVDERSRMQRYSIQSSIDAVDRALPDSLVGLWLRGKVPSEQLPLLLHGLAPQLSRSDYWIHNALNPIQRAVRRWAAVAGGALIGGLGLSMLGGDMPAGLAMLGCGLLTSGGSLALARRFSGRRRRQIDWVTRWVTAQQSARSQP